MTTDIDFTRLTHREMEVLKLASLGFSSKEIARDTKMAHKTVEVHRHRLIKKSGARNMIQCVAEAIRTRMIP